MPWLEKHLEVETPHWREEVRQARAELERLSGDEEYVNFNGETVVYEGPTLKLEFDYYSAVETKKCDLIPQDVKVLAYFKENFDYDEVTQELYNR